MKPFDDSELDEDALPPISPLTREEAQALLARQPSFTVWQALAWQTAFGLLVALVWGVVTWSPSAFASALYGAAVVVVPNAMMARGVFGRNAGRSVGGLVLWEVLKLCLSGALMVLAPAVLSPVHWAALLVTLVVCLKSIGLALFLQQRRTKKTV
ncbi:MAG: ATP synthase subunit I [Burkholderiales bacterium]|nr:ATP synthase subunit I [Burkholderiales bacterium]